MYEQVNVKRRKTDSTVERKFSSNIFLLNKRVCKQFFLKTFDISNKRFTSICRKTNHLGVVKPDKRGKGQTHRRISSERRTSIIRHKKNSKISKSLFQKRKCANKVLITSLKHKDYV